MLKENIEVRNAAQDAGLKLWQIAEKFGISDGNFSRKLRRKLTTEEKVRVFKIIEDLKGRGTNGEK